MVRERVVSEIFISRDLGSLYKRRKEGRIRRDMEKKI